MILLFLIIALFFLHCSLLIVVIVLSHVNVSLLFKLLNLIYSTGSLIFKSKNKMSETLNTESKLVLCKFTMKKPPGIVSCNVTCPASRGK